MRVYPFIAVGCGRTCHAQTCRFLAPVSCEDYLAHGVLAQLAPYLLASLLSGNINIDTIRIKNYYSCRQSDDRSHTPMASRYSEPLFVISVAARLVEMHPQTLRKYEREGLIAPSRTAGNLRLYSDEDIERLRQVKYLVETRGLNLAGVQLALELTQSLRKLRASMDRSPDSRAWTEDLDRILVELGFVEQQQIRENARRR